MIEGAESYYYDKHYGHFTPPPPAAYRSPMMQFSDDFDGIRNFAFDKLILINYYIHGHTR